jgi:hypothetical protein
MKKLIGLMALLITANFSMVGYQSYSHRDERAVLESMQERLLAAETTLAERDAAVKKLHISLTYANETIARDSASLDAFEARHRGGISDYKLYNGYKQRVAAWNESVKQYNITQAEWESLDRKLTADVRAYNMLADSVRLTSAKLDSTRSLVRFPLISLK